VYYVGPDFMLRHILAPVGISFHCMVMLDDELYDFFCMAFSLFFIFHFLRLTHTEPGFGKYV